MSTRRCWRAVKKSFLFLLLLFTTRADEQRRRNPLRCSYTRNVFCECGNRYSIFSLSIETCRFDIFLQSCGNCLTKELSSKVCENFYSCRECGTSLEECLNCLTGKNCLYNKEDKAVANYREKSKQLSKRQVEAVCTKYCENGGRCEGDTCICNNEYRGDTCQYAVSLCNVEKTDSPSAWQCVHTHISSTCRIACYPPGSVEAERNFGNHVCSLQGLWNPPLPQCVRGAAWVLCNLEKTNSPSSWQCNNTRDSRICRIACYPPGSVEAEKFFETHVCSLEGIWTPPLPSCIKGIVTVQCSDPGHIANGQREPVSGSFFAGNLASFVCDDHFILHGESTISCLPTGKWSAEKPFCYRSKAYCPQPRVPENAEVLLYLKKIDINHTLHQDSTDYERGEFPVKLNRGFLSASEESFDSLTSPGSLPIGSRVQYKCSSRFYKLYGSEFQTCLPSGSWSGYQTTCVPQCGISDDPRTPFITNGNLTAKGQWPWQVGISVHFKEENRWHLACGGSLLNERWIVTAAHCVTKAHSNTPTDPKSLALFLGKYYRSFEKDDSYVQMKKAAQVVVHNDYDFTKYDADIALLQLETPAKLTSRVQPICLPSDESTRENIRDGKVGVVTGWGVTEDHYYSETLRQTRMPVVSHLRCEQGYRESLRSITVTENMFCAGYSEGRIDTCNGDSGGPMMFLDESQRPKRWILEGIVSWGSGSGCGKANHYAGFAKVKSFVSWIRMHI